MVFGLDAPAQLPADAASPDAPLECPAEFAGERYLYVGLPGTWLVADAHCKALDDGVGPSYVHLAVVETVLEAAALPVPPGAEAWVGLRNEGGAWRWITDELAPAAPIPWDLGKPDLGGGDCGTSEGDNPPLDNSGCTSMKSLVCECDRFPAVR